MKMKINVFETLKIVCLFFLLGRESVTAQGVRTLLRRLSSEGRVSVGVFSSTMAFFGEGSVFFGSGISS